MRLMFGPRVIECGPATQTERYFAPRGAHAAHEVVGAGLFGLRDRHKILYFDDALG